MTADSRSTASSLPLTSPDAARGLQDQSRFNYVAPAVRPLPAPLACLRRNLFSLFMTGVFVGPVIFVLVEYFIVGERDGMKRKIELASIPIVSVAFTWWHVWLGIQMCWYPIEFWGKPPCLGWQGIVPRRAHIMAGRACDIMIGNLVTIEEIIDRVEPEDFFKKLGPVLGATSADVLAILASKHCPKLWHMLPDSVKAELKERILEESQHLFKPVISDLKRNVKQIFDIKQMAIDALVTDKALLVKMFQEIGSREFTFVLHVAAVMGFFLGLVQMFLFDVLVEPWNKVTLPVSGLVIGYFTNWLAITMIFRPVYPHIICGGYINIQGVFLKRQKQVSKDMSGMICNKLIYARRMLEFIVKTDGFQKVLNIYQKHMDSTVDKVVGGAKAVLPVFVGSEAIGGIKEEVIQVTMDVLPKYSESIESYLDETFAINEIIAPRLAGLPPNEFEGMLRPVFQEDEWMILLLGGVLGVVVGTTQALVLGH